MIRQLQQGLQTAQNAQKVTESLNEIAERRLPKATPRQTQYRPKVGERIRIPSLGQTAEVLSVAEESEEVSIRFGIIRTTV